MISNIWQRYQVTKDHSKITKMYIWMIQRDNKEVFGHFLEFGWSDWFQIAYLGFAKQSWGFGFGVTHVLHLDHSIITSRWYKMTYFDQFLTIFSSLVHWVDFVLHILILLKGLHDFWYYHPGFASESFNNNVILVQKKLFWSVFGHFLKFDSLNRLHITYFDTYTWSSRIGNFQNGACLLQGHSKELKLSPVLPARFSWAHSWENS